MPLGCWFTGPFNLTSRMMMFLPEGVEILRIMVRYLARSLLVVAVEPTWFIFVLLDCNSDLGPLVG
jgi:hypothetical protein